MTETLQKNSHMSIDVVVVTARVEISVTVSDL